MVNSIITQVFMSVLSMSLTASVTGLILTVIYPFTRKYFSMKWNYYIWLLVLVRLAVPFHFETDLLNFNADIQQIKPSVPDSVETVTVVSEDPAAHTTTVPKSAPQALAKDSNNTNIYTAQDKNLHNLNFSGASFLTFAAYLWISGVITALFIKLWGYQRFQSAIRKENVRITDYNIICMENTLCAKLGIHIPPAIYKSSGVSSPLTVGLRNPVIVFPENILCEHSGKTDSNEQDAAQFRLMLHHELLHVARKDLLYKWAYQILHCIHWFNPILCWFDRQVNCNCELSCDEAVIVHLTDTEKQMYGNILLDAAAQNISGKNNAFSTTMIENKKNLKKRLDGILHYAKRTRFQILLSICTFMVMFLIWACSGIRLTTDKTSEQQNDSASTVSESDVPISDESSLLSQIPYSSEADDWLINFGHSDPSGIGWKVYDDDTLAAGDDYIENCGYGMYYGNGDPTYGKRIDASAMILYGSFSIVITYAEQDVETDITSAFDIYEGKFKVVHIAPDGKVTTINDSGDETKQTVTMQKGRNVIKMIGQGAKVKKFAIVIAGLKKSDFEKVYYSVSEEESAQVMDSLQTGAPIDKDKALRNISLMSKTEISDIFHSLLISRVTFTADDFHCFFMHSDRELSSKYFVEAIENGYQDPPDAESASIIMPYIDRQYKVRLFMQLPPETFYGTFMESLPYLDENQIKECLISYIQKGGELTDTDFSKISQYLDENAVNELRVVNTREKSAKDS